MPKKKMDEELDMEMMGMEEMEDSEMPMEDDMYAEDEMDMEMPMDEEAAAMDLESISDEELMAELRKRGLMSDMEESEEEEMMM